MKTRRDIDRARRIIRRRIVEPGLTELQKTLMIGMAQALIWCADGEDCRTMKMILDDVPMAAGKDHAAALELLRRFTAAADPKEN